jgi:hypothetical protein
MMARLSVSLKWAFLTTRGSKSGKKLGKIQFGNGKRYEIPGIHEMTNRI